MIRARIERMAPGDVISGSLSAWLKNIDGEDIQTRTTDAIAIVDNRGDPAEILEDNLSIVQRRIIEHFRKRVLELDEDVLAVLARHELQFIRIP